MLNTATMNDKEKNLNLIIQKLEIQKLSTRDSLYGITVFDNDTMETIARNKTGEELKEHYGSLNEYFENLVKQGYKNITIKLRKKNGSSWQDTSEPIYKFNFEPKEIVSNDFLPMPQSPIMPTLNSPNVGLKGFTTLSIPELLEHHSNGKDLIRLTEENKYLKIHNEDLKKQNDSYREVQFQNSFSLEEKKMSNDRTDKFLEALSPLVPILAEKFMGNNNAPAPIGMLDEATLGHPEYSDNKNDLINYISKSTDEMVDTITLVINHSNKNEFSEDLKNLISKYSENEYN